MGPRSARLAIAVPLGALLLVALDQDPAPEVLGAGTHRYAWHADWFAAGEAGIGRTHGALAVLSDGRLLASSDGRGGVLVFDRQGGLSDEWDLGLGAGVHGLTVVRDGDEELVLLSHHRAGEVLATTTAGEVRWRLTAPEGAGLYPDDARFRPTATAVAPDGRLFVADGYGEGWVHRYDAERVHLGSFGGRGTAPGQFRVPHGLVVDDRVDPPQLLVADRENGRLQAFSLEGELLCVLPVDVRRPCSLVLRDGHVVIAELEGRVTILDRENEVLCRLGENPDPAQWARPDTPREAWREGVFFAPHHATWDDRGNLYVMDWSREGRITRLDRLR